MANRLDGRKVAVLVADGFEQVELTEPVKALKEAGAQVKIVSPMKGQVQGVNHDKKATPSPWTSRWTAPMRVISTRCCCPAAS